MGRIGRFLGHPRFTDGLKFVLDELVPPILRDIRWLNALWIKLCNRSLDLDFKQKVLAMSADEVSARYAAVNAARGEDWTDLDSAQIDFLVSHLAPGTVLDVGAGCGAFAIEAAKRGRHVAATEIDVSLLRRVGSRANANGLLVALNASRVEALPFADSSFDNVVCAHVLEHVVDLYGAIREVIRVARHRVLVIVPKERYFRYTANYHLHFFGGPEQLVLAMGLREFHAELRGRCICYCGSAGSDIRRTPSRSPAPRPHGSADSPRGTRGPRR